MAYPLLPARMARRCLVAALVVTVAVVAPVSASALTAGSGAAQAAPVWSQLGGGPRHSGYNPLETTLTPSTVPGLKQRWATPTGGTSGWPAAIVGGGVYVGSRHHAGALRADTGQGLLTPGGGAE